MFLTLEPGEMPVLNVLCEKIPYDLIKYLRPNFQSSMKKICTKLNLPVPEDSEKNRK